jgi:hypothetical protein
VSLPGGFQGPYNDQQIFIISHGETISRSSWAPFVVEARIEPSTFRPVSPTLYPLSYPACHGHGHRGRRQV